MHIQCWNNNSLVGKVGFGMKIPRKKVTYAEYQLVFSYRGNLFAAQFKQLIS